MNNPRPQGAPVDSGTGQRGRLAPAGFVDELGERSLSFDPSSETIVETLRLKREFSDSNAFEGALRSRVARVGRLSHPSLAMVQSVDRTDDGLVLISTYASGRRLSELGPNDSGIGRALDVIRQVTPALSALHQASPGSGHGALSLNRIVMTHNRRLILVEHVLAPALESLHWSHPRFNDLGLVVPDEVPVRLDERTDLRQLGWIILSLLHGNPVSASEYSTHARSLLDAARRTHDALSETPLGDWLGRMLQVAPHSFAAAHEAEAAFEEFTDDPALKAAEEDGALLAFPSEPEPQAPPAARSEPASNVVEVKPLAPVLRPVESAPRLRAVPAPATAPVVKAPAAKVAPRTPAAVAPVSVLVRNRWGWVSDRVAIWVACTFALIGIMEALAIINLLTRPLIIVAPPTQETATSARPSITFANGSPADTAPAARLEPSPTPAANAPRPSPPAAAARVTGFAVIAPIDLDVFSNGTRLGSSTGPLALAAGRYSLEFRNEALGFRTSQVVTIVDGQTTPVPIAIPEMRVSVNASPWADVTIDGVAVGQTPLGNVSLMIGPHEFVFRNPDFPERRQTVVVRADTPTRVTQNFK